MQCIHGLAAPHLQAQLARMPAALQMGPKERAVYLGRKVLRGVKVGRPTSLDHNVSNTEQQMSLALISPVI